MDIVDVRPVLLVSIISLSSSNVQEITLDRLSLDLVLNILSDFTHALATTPLDEADDANNSDNGNKDDETEDEVSILIISRADSLLDDDSLHLCHDVTLLVYCYNFFRAICLRHNLGCHFTSGISLLMPSVLVLCFVSNYALFELIPVELFGLSLLILSHNWDAFNLSTEDPGIHERLVVLNEVSVDRIDSLKVDELLILLLVSLQDLELDDS